ncbi:exodeoxyribonuclease VII large subunit [Helicobacter aurati]|uniref:exodeoxyribonuclease VII large subunit n=1 Tax=Helicobacter aurati TaxID=137778 RepID=UPI001F29383C|nr:exodeoxyribonuclease VII large subunit [Helicobacter aurati]
MDSSITQNFSYSDFLDSTQKSNRINGQYIFKVSDLTTQIKALLESDFRLVAVTGEISGLVRHSSGHIYFSLKDSLAVISCTFFRSNVKNHTIALKNGDKVIAKGNISVYPPRGTYSLNVQTIHYDGEGSLKAQYDALKQDLQKRNYFCKNKPLPRFPKQIVLLTSRSSAALQDMIKVAKTRFNALEFFLIDTPTQGTEAKFVIAKNIRYADSLGADILVLARGGGSIEDLWNFNEIEVLEAIFACKTLVVSAIGHEVDYLLSDYVADCRAPTPSAAMEMILQDKNALLTQMIDLENHLRHTLQNFIESRSQRLHALSERLELCHPLRLFIQHKQMLDMQKQALRDSVRFFFHTHKQNLAYYHKQLMVVLPTHRISSVREGLKFHQKRIASQMLIIIRQKKQVVEFVQQRFIESSLYFLNKKRIQLPPSLFGQCTELLLRLMGQKKERLQHLESLVESMNPTKNLQLGFAQILKDNKPIQLSKLVADDIIEIVDSHRTLKAKIL